MTKPPRDSGQDGGLEGERRAAARTAALRACHAQESRAEGNAVQVLATDAYDLRLLATLSKPPRPDVHLSVKPIMPAWPAYKDPVGP